MSSWVWVAGVVVVLLALGATLVGGRSRPRRPGRTPPRTTSGPGRNGAGPAARTGAPRRGEIWWADVPFEDRPGSKDRPCLVLSVRGGTARVVKITSRFHGETAGVVPLPAGAVDDADHRQSYLETNELRRVPLSAFRRPAGALDPQVMTSLKLS